ncbi:hypothetical protein ZIOFF_058607 [Zingiber officinale]|uniref:Uncharacterized protein n=1 Tax=Zingiber officinale TaxID=94328 RepID=A0A8J5KM36_ZINOF|nr:hypothetical protein ZIOFF_058607 [Zingiber officinale]
MAAKPLRERAMEQGSDQSLSDEDEPDQVTYDLNFSGRIQSLLFCGRKKVELLMSENGIHRTNHEDHEVTQNQLREDHHAVSSSESISDEVALATIVFFLSIYMKCNQGICCLGNVVAFLRLDSFCFMDSAVLILENMVLTELSDACPAHVQGSLVGSVRKNQEGECTSLEVMGESKELSSLHKKACSSSFTSRISEPRKGYRSRFNQMANTNFLIGGKSKSKAKFSIRSDLHSRKLPSSCSMEKNENPFMATYKSFGEHVNLDYNTSENVMVHLKQHQKVVPAKLAPDKIVGALPSMAELLEDLAKHGQATEALDVKSLKNARSKEIKTPYSGRTVSHLGSRFLDNEDPLEFMGCGTSSEDEEWIHNHSSFPRESIKQHTMGDLFQETFNVSAEGSSSLPKHRSTGSSYYGRVQQVIQIEKERHLELSKQPQTVLSVHNELSIMVQIITRFLEAKLTVCHCLFLETFEGEAENGHKGQCENDSKKFAERLGNLRTIIFSSKFCSNVELEVGSYIRIHPPWKEVRGFLEVPDTGQSLMVNSILPYRECPHLSHLGGRFKFSVINESLNL